jgi:predicted nuclease with TOPRIM domain
MPSPRDLFAIECPCCQASLKVDPQTRAVITYKEKERPKPVEDLREAVQKLKGEEARRDEVFRKAVEDQKGHQQVLSRKFDELLKQAKSNPDTGPWKKDIDLD